MNCLDRHKRLEAREEKRPCDVESPKNVLDDILGHHRSQHPQSLRIPLHVQHNLDYLLSYLRLLDVRDDVLDGLVAPLEACVDFGQSEQVAQKNRRPPGDRDGFHYCCAFLDVRLYPKKNKEENRQEAQREHVLERRVERDHRAAGVTIPCEDLPPEFVDVELVVIYTRSTVCVEVPRTAAIRIVIRIKPHLKPGMSRR